MKTVTTTAIQALIHQVLFDIGITKEGAYQIIQNNSINATMIIWDHCGMAEESIVQNFNEDVKNFIASEDKVEMKLVKARFIVTTNYSIIEEQDNKPIKVIIQKEESKSSEYKDL